MALDQTTLSTTTRAFLKRPNSHVSNTKFLSSLQLFKSKKTTFPLKCSLDLNNNYQQQQQQHAAVTYPKPAEIQWKRELCNSVSLIGVVGASVEIKHLNSGKTVAWTRLAVRKSASDTSWISLTFWNELAHIASQHVQKGQQIYVSGRLISDTVENGDGKSQTFYKVVVQQLNFIEKNTSSVSDRDFDSMAGGKKFANNSTNGTGSTEELWQAFFANPVEWWDNRKNKRSPKYPDFKHKDTGEALWVEGRNNPPWVRSQLAILDSRMVESFYDQESRRHPNVMTVDDLRF